MTVKLSGTFCSLSLPSVVHRGSDCVPLTQEKTWKLKAQLLPSSYTSTPSLSGKIVSSTVASQQPSHPEPLAACALGEAPQQAESPLRLERVEDPPPTGQLGLWRGTCQSPRSDSRRGSFSPLGQQRARSTGSLGPAPGIRVCSPWGFPRGRGHHHMSKRSSARAQNRGHGAVAFRGRAGKPAGHRPKERG